MTVSARSRRFLVSTLFVAFVVACSVGFAADNVSLVRNGDFKELTAPNKPDQWSTALQPAHGSNYSIRVENEGFGDVPALRLDGAEASGRAIVVQREIHAEAYRNKKLKITAAYKGDHVNKRSGAENFIRIEFFKHDGQGLKNSGTSQAIHAPSGSTEWIVLENEFVVPPETDVMWISISLRESSGTARWADIKMHESGSGVGRAPKDTERTDYQVGSNQLPYAPADGAVVTTNPPSFVWIPVSDAASYSIEYSPDQDFSPDVTTRMDKIEMSIYTPSEPLDEGVTWYWRVRATGSNGSTFKPSEVRAFRISPESIRLDLPPMDDIRSRLPRSHPRLFVTPDVVDQWRSQAQSDLLFKTLFSSIRTRALSLTFEPLPDEPPHARPGGVWDVELWREYVTTVRATDNMETLAFAYMMTGDESFGDAARRWLLHIASWDPAGATSAVVNDESSMPILLKLSRAYTWAYDALSEEDRQVIRDVMRIRGEEAYTLLKRIPFESNPYGSHQGRSLGFLGEAAMAFLGEIPEAEVWFDYVVKIFYAIYPAWGGDPGGWAEGHAYWTTYMNRVLWFVDAFQAGTGLNLYDKAFFQNTGMFKLYTQPPYSKIGPFGDFADAPPSSAAGDVMAHFAHVYQNPYYKWYSQSLGSVMETGVMGFIRAMLHPSGRLTGKAPLDLPSSAHFPDIGWVALHKRLGESTDAIQLMFKSSPYGSFSHSLADQNTFTLEAYGTPLAISSGYRPWYGSEHHMKWTKTTQAHNGILVNGEGQRTQSLAARGEITSFLHGESFDYTAGDATLAYTGSLQRYIRHIVYVRPDVFILFDDLNAPAASTFSWLLHTYHELEMDEPGGRIFVDADSATLTARLWSPQPLVYSQTNEFAIPLDEPMNKPEQWHFSATTTDATRDAHFLAVLVPSKAGVDRTVDSEPLHVDHGVGVVVVDEQIETTLLFRTEEGVLVSDELRIDGAVGAKRRKHQETNISGLLLIQGTRWESEDGLCLKASTAIDAELTFTRSSKNETTILHGTVVSPSGPGSDVFDIELSIPGSFHIRNVRSNGEDVPDFSFENGRLSLRLDPGENRLQVVLEENGRIR